MGYFEWVKSKWDEYDRNKIIQENQKREEQKQKEVNTNNENDGCAGCGCLIVVIIVLIGIFKVISWGWHIHWLFGVLLLFFFLRLL